MTAELQSSIMFGVGILGVIFTIYHYFRNPQIRSEKTDMILGERLKNMDEQMMDLRKNHVYTLDVKLDATINQVQMLGLQVAKLETIIEERIPRKEI